MHLVKEVFPRSPFSPMEVVSFLPKHYITDYHGSHYK